MNQIDRDTAHLLAPLRELEPDTPSQVDVGRAVLDVRRRVRRRRVLGATAAVAVAALVVATVPSVAGGLLDRKPPAESGAGLTEFDVMRQSFRVGSAAGFTPLTYETERYVQKVTLVPATPGAGEHRATVSMFARDGLGPDWKPAAEPDNEPAPDVNGRRAVWMTGVPGTANLAFEWADGAWAIVEVRGDDARIRAHRVAQSVEAGVDVPVTVPFTLSRAQVERYQVVGTTVSYGQTGRSDGNLRATLMFGLGSSPDLVVGVQQDGAGKPPGAETVVRNLGHGFRAFAEYTSPNLVTQVSKEQRLGELLGSVRLVGSPTNPEYWVSDPLR